MLIAMAPVLQAEAASKALLQGADSIQGTTDLLPLVPEPQGLPGAPPPCAVDATPWRSIAADSSLSTFARSGALSQACAWLAWCKPLTGVTIVCYHGGVFEDATFILKSLAVTEGVTRLGQFRDKQQNSGHKEPSQ
jgi:hypothetical protein